MAPGPGVGGPGPGVIPVGASMTMPGPGPCPEAIGPGGSSVVACQYCEAGAGGVSGPCNPGGTNTSQIAFLGDDGLQVQWCVGGSMFDSSPLVVPGRQDFPQGAIYRLKLTNIPGREAISLYPTLEVAPVTPRTDAYLAHAPIPVQFTEEDFDQVISGNYVTKVIYLPDPEFQELALAGVETLVSTRLDPGCDPVAEADRRGSILAVVRIGNKDLEGGQGSSYGAGVMPAQYEDGVVAEPYYEGEGAAPMMESLPGDAAGSCPVDGGGAAMGPGYGQMPMGVPTGAYGPPSMPPHMMAGGPQYGMPITGTPIGLPGPPHIPLGIPAGLRKHSMTNHTRVHLPAPTSHLHVGVKQRPGMNYPAPVNTIHVNETHRAPLDCVNGTLPSPWAQAAQAVGQAHPTNCNCNECSGQ